MHLVSDEDEEVEMEVEENRNDSLLLIGGSLSKEVVKYQN
ncbi:5907_t:CDS:2 [Entrophospora sp. SA101]|nr:5907_t:CDS:2 [Entrophospora sp. SA101]